MKKILVLVFCFYVISAAAQVTIPAGTTEHWHPNTMPVINGDITLEEGAILYIHGCTLEMPNNTQILIKKNARLHVYNSQIKGTDLKGVTWLGIRCDPGSVSAQDRIPYVLIKDSEFSGAEIAFINATHESSNHWGGAIVANNVDFVNNKIFLILKNYTYNQKSMEHARFIKCKFRETANCYTGADFILLEDVDNVFFRGCEFLYYCPNPRTGIKAINSKFSITSFETFLPYQKTYNDFFGFDRAVCVENDPSVVTKPVTIADCIFTTHLQQISSFSKRVINLKGCYNANVYSNTINLQHNSWAKPLIGIHLEDCPVFSVQDNTITISADENNTYGIVVINSGDKTNTLYRNTINNAEVGIQAIGKNRKNTIYPNEPELGLKFLCNTITSFDDAYYIDVNNCYNAQGVIGVSRFQQGAIADEPLSPNFNLLHPRTLSGTPPPENDFQNIALANADVSYVIPYDATLQHYGIQYVTSNVFISDDQNTSKDDPHCESRTPCFGPFCLVVGPAPITLIHPQLTSIKTQLEELLNGGDHQTLLNMVNTVDENNVDEIFDILLNSTPSTDILAIACGNDIFTPEMITGLLIENSYGIKYYEVRDALEIRNEPLDEYQLSEIYTAAESISVYEEYLMTIEHMIMEYSDYMNRELYYLASRDTVPIDSIRDYLSIYNDFFSIVQLIHLEFNQGNINEAYDWHDSLQNFLDNPDQLEAYNALFDEILTDVYENLNGDFSLLTIPQIQLVHDLTEQLTYAAGFAKFILSRYFDQDFESHVCPVIKDSFRKKPTEQKVVDKNTLLVYPNPAESKINIEFSVNTTTKSFIEIFDITGKSVLIHSTYNNFAQIDVSSLKKGYYVIRLISENTVLSSPLIIK